MTSVRRRPPRLPDGTRVHVRSDHFAGECDGVISAAEFDEGWLYRVEVTRGDRLDGERNDAGELWACEFEVHPAACDAPVGGEEDER